MNIDGGRCVCGNIGCAESEASTWALPAHAKRDPDFADAHCNLGLLLESIGSRQEAIRHLMAARQLMDSAE